MAEEYAEQLDGVLPGSDRIVLTGSLMPFCDAHGMTKYLNEQPLRIFDYAQLAQPWAEQLRATAEALAQAHDLTLEYIRKKAFRKEARLEAILQQRGRHPGLVHIFSALEPCASDRPWQDTPTHKTFLKSEGGQGLHDYFSFIDDGLGLCSFRVSTWGPFRVQIYFNGQAWLANQLNRKGIAYHLHDNAFTPLADDAAANDLAAHFDVTALPRRWDEFVERDCPSVKTLSLSYPWSFWPAEYATDLVFKHRRDWQDFFPPWLETLVLSVKPDDIAAVLGQKLQGNDQGEVPPRWPKRGPGTRFQPTLGPVSLKLYDKFGLILRLETTVHDVPCFQQRRVVEHRTGAHETKWAPMKKTRYNPEPLRDLLQAAHRRYLEFLSALETPAGGEHQVQRLADSQTDNGHPDKGFNVFAADDARLFRLLLRGEFAISGLPARALRALMPDQTSGQVSRLLTRRRVPGLLKKISLRYKYYLTDLGRQVLTLALTLREQHAGPALARA